MRGDGRLLDQIRADILMDLLEGHHVEGVTGGGAVEVRVDLTTLLDLDERAGEIPGWGPVVSDIARQIVQRQSDGKWEFVVTDPDTGALIASGVTRRRPTAAQRRHVQAIHPTCIFMGCRTPSRKSHIDHTREYALAGPTLVGNLGPLCEGDHLGAKHKRGWKLVQPENGVFVWTSPRGLAYVVTPEPP
jgi:hypothetical protein